VPALEALHHQFHEAKTQAMGVSIDSVYCHANWAQSLGGVSLPLLSDFHPKGEVAKSYGLYLDEAGITDRATVIIDAGGVVRHISSVTPAGKRDMDELLELCKKIDAEYKGDVEGFEHPTFPNGGKLYVKSNCGFSTSVLTAVANLHLNSKLEIINCSEDEKALAALKELTSKEQAPCLILDGDPILESADIIKELVIKSTGF
jgi:glutaredoxin-related protein